MKKKLILSIFVGMLVQTPGATASENTREIIEQLTEGSGVWQFNGGSIYHRYISQISVKKGIGPSYGKVHFRFETSVSDFGNLKTYTAEYIEHSGYTVADNEVVIQEQDAFGRPLSKLFRCQFNIVNLEIDFECSRIFNSSSPYIIGSYFEEFRRENMQSRFALSQP